MNTKYWIGVDLGGTKVLTALFDQDLNLIRKTKQPSFSEKGPLAVFESIVSTVNEVIEGINKSDISGMGFGVPGQITPNSTVVRFAPNLDWRDLEVKNYLPADWKWPLVLHNDTRMATYGEYALGAAKGAKDVFGIFVGTGVGGGLIFNHQLYEGFLGHAGEIGHIVIHWKKGKSLEMIAGRRSMINKAKEKLDEYPKENRKAWKGIETGEIKSSKLAELFTSGEPLAVRLIEDACKALGASIATVVNLLSPEVVVVGGGVTESLKQPFIDKIWEHAQAGILPKAADGMKFVAASLGDMAGATGCAAYAKAKLGK